MKTKPLSMSLGPYPRAVVAAVGDAAVAGAWTATGALPPGRRRVVRAGVTAATVAVAGGLFSPASGPDGHDGGQAPPEPSGGATTETPPTLPTRLQLVALAAGVGVSVALRMGGRRLERRWLASLERSGHAHPHRAVALRVAALSLAATLPSRLFEAHAASRAAGDRRPVGPS
jgi:hypothetical protein